ncbi:TonB-dependent receptor [Lewinella sp. W8]|uniref:TonB-dependent receptor domain-containing protein n=1 Tax=Lewinella sp. W8 TaxID=2528208 RepID=UPI0010688293|nr:TonB-dependent receptor [Lewinella sp. W8]MTB51453.1 TonB-dependent receptor [Lewinella sp. W8]
MRLITLLGLLALASNLLATALPNSPIKAALSGTVVTEDGQPLEYATVSAYTSENTLANGTVTDEKGQFTLQLPHGDYQLKIEFIGFATRDIPVELSGKTDLGNITIGQDALTLEAVEVRADKSQMELKLDKKVFNVGKDALAQGGDATDVLAQVPSVTVSAEGSVSLRGNGSVRILVNGRPSALADNGSLEGIPANSIERVEIITNPSAKYEAEGSAGIINIVLKKNQQRGYGGTISLGTGFPADHRANVNLNLRHEKFNAFANVGGRYANFRGDGELSRTSTIEGEITNLVRVPDMDRNDRAYSVYTGFDYNLSERGTLTASYSRYDVINDDISVNTYDYSDGEFVPFRSLRQVEDYLEPGLYQQIDVLYNHNFSDERKLSLQFSHDRWAETESQGVMIEETFPALASVVDYQTESIESSEDYLAQADYEAPLGEYGKLELGLRAESRVISSDYFAERATENGYAPIPGFAANKFDYFEQIGAAYFQYGYEKEAIGFQLGLRAETIGIETENSEEAANNINKNFLQLFPSASIQYKLTDGISSQVSYSRRIRRPAFWQLSPFAGIRLPSSLFFGNPDLNPSFTNRVEWNLLMRGEKLTFNPAIYYSFITDYFQNVLSQEPGNLFGLNDGTIISRPTNLQREGAYGVEADLGYRPTETLNFNLYGRYYGYSQRGNVEGRSFDFDFATWTASIRAQIRLPKELSFQTRIGYNAYREDAQSENPGVFNGSAAISKEWDNKYTVTVNVYAPRYFRENTFLPTFRQEDFFQWTGWRFGLNLQYRFEKGARAEGRRQRGSIR